MFIPPDFEIRCSEPTAALRLPAQFFVCFPKETENKQKTRAHIQHASQGIQQQIKQGGLLEA